jgi:hypothetical protein
VQDATNKLLVDPRVWLRGQHLEKVGVGRQAEGPGADVAPILQTDSRGGGGVMSKGAGQRQAVWGF